MLYSNEDVPSEQRFNALRLIDATRKRETAGSGGQCEDDSVMAGMDSGGFACAPRVRKNDRGTMR